MITWPLDTKRAEMPPIESVFVPDGKFLNTETPGGRLLKSDGFPAFRRISLLVCLEERMEEKYPFPHPTALVDNHSRSDIWPNWGRARDSYYSIENVAWIEHNVLIIHNPYAYYSISNDLFNQFPQLIPIGDEMKWTDGKKIIV